MKDVYIVIRQPTGGKDYCGAYKINLCHYIIKRSELKQYIHKNYSNIINNNVSIYPPIIVFNNLIKDKEAYSCIEAIDKCKQLNKRIYENSKRICRNLEK